jgi:hypothetical protein
MPGVVRDLDLTAAYGIEAAVRVRDSAAAGFRSTVTERHLDHARRCPSSPPVNAIRASCPAFVQVSIQTRKGPLGSCTHHYDTAGPGPSNPPSGVGKDRFTTLYTGLW